MFATLEAKSSPAKPAKPVRPAAEPIEIREVGEYRTTAPDGSLEIVKKRIVVYESPVPCNNEANRAAAESRRRHQDAAGDLTETGFFNRQDVKVINKDQIRRDLEEQIVRKREADEQRRRAEAELNKNLIERATQDAQHAKEAERRRSNARREEVRRALESSCARKDKQTVPTGQTSFIIRDDAESLARTRALNRQSGEAQRKQLEEKQRQADQQRRQRNQEDVERAQRAAREEKQLLEAQRAQKVAQQQRTADELRRSRDAFLQQQAATVAVEKDRNAKSVKDQLNTLESRAQREQELRKVKRQEFSEVMARQLKDREARKAQSESRQVVTRVETKVLMRCPATGKCLPPEEFNARRR